MSKTFSTDFAKTIDITEDAAYNNDTKNEEERTMYHFSEKERKEIDADLKRARERQKMNGNRTYSTEEVIEYIKQLTDKIEKEQGLYIR